MFQARIITIELRDNPVYNTIEEQFTSLMNYHETKEEFEKDCQAFLGALTSQGGPLITIGNKIKQEWKDHANSEVKIDLSL